MFGWLKRVLGVKEGPSPAQAKPQFAPELRDVPTYASTRPRLPPTGSSGVRAKEPAKKRGSDYGSGLGTGAALGSSGGSDSGSSSWGSSSSGSDSGSFGGGGGDFGGGGSSGDF